MNIDFSNFPQLVAMMDNSEKYSTAILAENENGELMQIGVYPDYICAYTTQANGWTRKNFYYRDGTTEELFFPLINNITI